MYYRERRANLFEVIIIGVGIIVMILGFIFLRDLYLKSPELSWNMITATFSYLMVILLFLVAAICVDIKEELSLIFHEQLLETRLMRNAFEKRKDKPKHKKK
jgi:membrane-bound ClpP family serine protease